MEFASYLAGERWSDHPACTHALLASVARQVNDLLSDARRAEIVELVPDVVGLTSSDPRVDFALTVRAASTALPIASEPRQNVLAAGLLAALNWYNTQGQPAPESPERSRVTRALIAEARDALERAPLATRWAEGLMKTVGASPRWINTEAPANIVRVAVEGIADACVADPEQLLVGILRESIAICELFAGSSDERAAQPLSRSATSSIPD